VVKGQGNIETIIYPEPSHPGYCCSHKYKTATGTRNSEIIFTIMKSWISSKYALICSFNNGMTAKKEHFMQNLICHCKQLYLLCQYNMNRKTSFYCGNLCNAVNLLLCMLGCIH
jgi:hypothetical protein